MAIPVLEEEQGRAQALAQSLSFELCSSPPEKGYYLVWQDQWVLRNKEQGDHFVLHPQLFNEYKRFKVQKISPKKDLLCRALGFKGQEDYRVLDGTMGFAADSMRLLAFGMQVVGCELDPLVFHLVESAKNVEGDKIPEFEIFHGDCCEPLVQSKRLFDAVYIDPMFEDVKKKSAPKKNLAFLRSLELEKIDVQRVIEHSIQAGIKRVVVKRPLNGENLYRKPNQAYRGKMIRFDVYTG